MAELYERRSWPSPSYTTPGPSCPSHHVPAAPGGCISRQHAGRRGHLPVALVEADHGRSMRHTGDRREAVEHGMPGGRRVRPRRRLEDLGMTRRHLAPSPYRRSRPSRATGEGEGGAADGQDRATGSGVGGHGVVHGLPCLVVRDGRASGSPPEFTISRATPDRSDRAAGTRRYVSRESAPGHAPRTRSPATCQPPVPRVLVARQTREHDDRHEQNASPSRWATPLRTGVALHPLSPTVCA